MQNAHAVESAGGTRTDAGPFGALVLSLDFELHWGVRERFRVDGPYGANLLGVRQAIPGMLSLFREFNVAATWGIVGFLFARDREERERFAPSLRPAYADAALDPYAEPTGESEADDPFHYAPSLVEQIRRTPRQEIASHTYSHYCCLAEGQTPEQFRADLDSAVEIACSRDIPMRTILLPHNQCNPDYAAIVREAGFTAYRGNPESWMYQPGRREGACRRVARLLDNYVDVGCARPLPWSGVRKAGGLYNVPATLFLRPYSPSRRRLEPLRLRRLVHLLRSAAETKQLVHLWWHPHNFGTHTDENLAFLRGLLEAFARLRESHGMQSLAINDVVQVIENGNLRRVASAGQNLSGA